MDLAYDGRHITELGAVPLSLRLGGHRAQFLGWGFIEPRPWRNYLHAHSFFEVCFAYAGRGVFRHGEAEYPVEAGVVFVARPGVVHEIVSSEVHPLGVQFWQFTLVAQPEPPGPDDGDVSRAGALLEAFAAGDGPLVAAAGERVPAVLELLTGEAAAPAPGRAETVHGLATALLLGTARAVVDDSSLTQAPSGSGGRDELAGQAMVRYLQDNHWWAVRIRDVAAQVHLSERHANRLFRRHTGTTIHAYLSRYRLDTAARRLAEDGASIKEIARLCGYPDVRAFTTAFRRRWGMTPAAFRAAEGTTMVEVRSGRDSGTASSRQPRSARRRDSAGRRRGPE